MYDPFAESDADFAARLKGKAGAGAGPRFVNGHRIRIKCTDCNPNRTIWAACVGMGDPRYWYFTNDHQPDSEGLPCTIHISEIGGVTDPEQAWQLIAGHLQRVIPLQRANRIDVKFDEEDTLYPAWTRTTIIMNWNRAHDDVVDSSGLAPTANLCKKRGE